MLGIERFRRRTTREKVQRQLRKTAANARDWWSDARDRWTGALDEARSVVRSNADRGATALRVRGVRTAGAAREAWERRPRMRVGRYVLAGGAAAGAFWLLRARRNALLPSWRGRVALITGGTRGLGLLVARELAADGCSIVVCARDPEELMRTEAELSGLGASVLTVVCDVSDESAVGEMVERALQRFGRIDVLLNNAGEIEVGPIEHSSVEDFRRARRVIFDGAVHCTLAVLPGMLERGNGNVINVSSIGGRIAIPHLVPYDSAKFALTGFSEGLRAELSSRGITVTTVFPGTMRTGSYRNARFRGQKEKEYTWFALGSTLPGLSMSAERAARAAIRGAKRGDAEVVVPLYAKVLTRLHGIAPATTSAMAACVARALPEATGQAGNRSLAGEEVEGSLDPERRRWMDRLTALGRRGGQRAAADDGTRARANVGGAERVLTAAAGGLIVAGGRRRRGPSGLVIEALGAALLARGATGRCPLYRSIGVDTTRRAGIRIRRSVTVDARPQEAYALWRDLEQLPRFLRHVSTVQVLGDGRSRWTIDVTGHPEVEFEAEIVHDEPGRRLSWRTVPSERSSDQVQHHGQVRFRPRSGGRGTVVDVDLVYRPTGASATLGGVYARVLDGITATQVRQDLKRFKEVLEAGRVPALEEVPAGAAARDDR